MPEKRRVYTAEFTRAAVRLVTAHGYGGTEAARTLGINVKMLGRGKRQAAQQTNRSIRGNGQRSVEHAELLWLRKENQRLRMEREMLQNWFAAPARHLCLQKLRSVSYCGCRGRATVCLLVVLSPLKNLGQGLLRPGEW